jgi:hypothetical protein
MAERKEERIKAFSPIDVYGINKPYSAISLNYSKGGLGMITNLDVSPGDSLKISCNHFWSEPKSAVVVWVKKINMTSKRVGLEIH